MSVNGFSTHLGDDEPTSPGLHGQLKKTPEYHMTETNASHQLLSRSGEEERQDSLTETSFPFHKVIAALRFTFKFYDGNCQLHSGFFN